MSHAEGPASSASVLEFICLYTHDLRRKQKRWEDGRLKFHTFNNRVMVYDDGGSYVGDMHWRRDYDFGEGEEIQLERGGVIVQVQDLVQQTKQDLSDLIDKRAKEKEQRQLQAVARARGPTSVLPQSMPQAAPWPVPSDHFQLRHRPLHQLIGTSSGHHGRASVPSESPYESRQQNADSPDDRAAKRRKYEDERPAKKGHAQALFGQTLTLSATPMSSIPARTRPRREPSSSISVDDQFDAGQNRENALREQSKSSLCFNHRKTASSTLPKAAMKASSGSTMHQSRGRVLDPRLKRATIPADAEIINVEDTDPTSSFDPPMAMPEPEERIVVKKVSKTEVRSKPNSSKQALKPQALLQSIPLAVETGKEQKPRNKKALNVGEQHPTAARPTGTEIQLRRSNEILDSTETTRKPDMPMTELRLKSTKRRGLLMMLDRPKGFANPRNSDASSTAVLTLDDADKAAGTDRPQPAILFSADENNEDSMRSDLPCPLGKSFELGEDSNPFRSPSPRPREQSCEATGRIDLENNGKGMETDSLVQREDDFETCFKAESLVMAEGVVQQPGVLEQTKLPGVSPRSHINDPFPLPPCSPEKEPQTIYKGMSESPKRAKKHKGDSTSLAVICIDDEEDDDMGVPKNHVTAAPRRKRKLRRNIVSDNEEEPVTLSELADDAESIGRDNITTDSNQDKAPQKHVNSPAQVANRKKLKPQTHGSEDSESENEEELPRRHRASTRKTRHRRVKSESPPESTEADSEHERPTKRRRNKVSQAFEERPRLAKVKKSVKSREVIGLDLSALNVPFGPRGIGVPFSILSPPAETSMQKKTGQIGNVPQPTSDAGQADDGPQSQLLASKEQLSAEETSQIPERLIHSSSNIDEAQSKSQNLTVNTTPNPRCAANSSSSGQNMHRSRTQSQQESSPHESSLVIKQDLISKASEQRPDKGQVDVSQLEDAGSIDESPQEDSKEELSPLVDASVGMPEQIDSHILAQERSSVKRGRRSDEKGPLNKQTVAQLPQREPSFNGSEPRKFAEQNDSFRVKTTAQDVSLKVSRDNLTTVEPVVPSVKTPGSGEGDQPETGNADPAASKPPDPRRTGGLRRTASAVRSINNLQKEATLLADVSEGAMVAGDSTKPVARIANPATRGRKAALKTHAAGQAPSRFLPPTQPQLLVPISTADLAMTPIEEPPKEPERPKRKMQFPGFQSARGEGPWSREAFDLLESGRPT